MRRLSINHIRLSGSLNEDYSKNNLFFIILEISNHKITKEGIVHFVIGIIKYNIARFMLGIQFIKNIKKNSYKILRLLIKI